MLPANELTKQKNDQIGVNVTLTELPKKVQNQVVIAVAKSDLVAFLVVI